MKHNTIEKLLVARPANKFPASLIQNAYCMFSVSRMRITRSTFSQLVPSGPSLFSTKHSQAFTVSPIRSQLSPFHLYLSDHSNFFRRVQTISASLWNFRRHFFSSLLSPNIFRHALLSYTLRQYLLGLEIEFYTLARQQV